MVSFQDNILQVQDIRCDDSTQGKNYADKLGVWDFPSDQRSHRM